MASQKGELGKRGEEHAANLLRKRGYAILHRNYRLPGGEIDIVARAPDGTLVFAEVKTLAEEPPEELRPEDQATAAKLKRMRRAAGLFANARPKLVREKRGWRIDLIAVVLTDPPVVRHHENV